MALIRCSECGKEISDKASVCVDCGCPVSVSLNTPITSVDKPVYLSVNFNATLADAVNDKTLQSVYVNELKRNVDFYIDNDTVVGDTLKITLQKNSRYEYILFNAVSVTKTQNANSVTLYSKSQSNQEVIKTIKNYEHNFFAKFLLSLGFTSIMVVIAFGIIKIASESNYDPDMITVAVMSTSFIWFPCLLGRIFYPMHHIKKYFKKHNIEDAIRSDGGSINVAISAYNTMPSKKMLRYIRRLNANAAQKIEMQLSKRKNK